MIWCKDNGHGHPGSVQMFGRNLRAVEPGIKVQNCRVGDGEARERVYEGVCLTDEMKTRVERWQRDNDMKSP